MKRRKFIAGVMTGSGVLAARLAAGGIPVVDLDFKSRASRGIEYKADLVIAGGGLGGCAAALAALRNGLRVILTEETDWIGGQLTQQGLSCPDEHPWIETHGATRCYRDLRTAIRAYYIRHYPLTDTARKQRYLNPGSGAVSRLCHEPRVALAVLNDLMAPYLSSGALTVLLNTQVTGADVNGDQIRYLKVRRNPQLKEVVLAAPYFIDATELGDLLPITGTEYVTGAESKAETGELHAQENADPANMQAITHCLAMEYRPGENHLIDKPENYAFWSGLVPKLNPPWSGKLLALAYSSPRDLDPKALGFNPLGVKTGSSLNLWNYRRIIDKHNFESGAYDSDITIVNWPENDYFLGNLVDVSEKQYRKNREAAKQLSLSLFYWLQTEAPRPDGGIGWPGLRLRGDIMGTSDGLAKYPYIRESRRIRAVFTILEEHVGAENRTMIAGKAAGKKSKEFYDTVGVGYYHIDLHPTTSGNNYVDFGSLPFQIPLGALLPVRMKNLLAANKNIGTTHITNGCYRLHPVEWNIGESAGMLAAYAHLHQIPPHVIREKRQTLSAFQDFIRSQGIETHWPAGD